MDINLALKINQYASSGFVVQMGGVSPTIPAHIYKDNDIMIIEYEEDYNYDV